MDVGETVNVCAMAGAAMVIITSNTWSSSRLWLYARTFILPRQKMARQRTCKELATKAVLGGRERRADAFAERLQAGVTKAVTVARTCRRAPRLAGQRAKALRQRVERCRVAQRYM